MNELAIADMAARQVSSSSSGVLSPIEKCCDECVMNNFTQIDFCYTCQLMSYYVKNSVGDSLNCMLAVGMVTLTCASPTFTNIGCHGLTPGKPVPNFLCPPLCAKAAMSMGSALCSNFVSEDATSLCRTTGMCLATNPTLSSTALASLTTMDLSASLQNWLKPNVMPPGMEDD